MPKTPAVEARLAARLAEKPVSATFLDTYLDCPLRFFYRYLSPLSPLTEVAEEGDRAAVGEVVHAVLREFFEPFIGRDIDGVDVNAAALMWPPCWCGGPIPCWPWPVCRRPEAAAG